MASIDPQIANLKSALAEEIRDVRRMIEEVADILVSDEQLAATYLEQLQAFDMIVQRAEESATLLDRLAAGSKPAEAVKEVRLSVLQDRLEAALKAA